MSTGMYIGSCKHCGTEAFLVGVNEVTWGTAYSNCEKHELKTPNDNGNGEEDMKKANSPISKSASFSSEFGARGEGNFPTENEAKYRKCLHHVQGKCGAFIRKYEDNLANLEEEVRKNEDEINNQYTIMVEKVEQRRKDLLEKLQTKKIERETMLNDLRDKLIHYEEKCAQGIQEIWKTVQSQEENLAREQQCEKIARTIALEIPIISSIPYSLKFDPRDMTRINTAIGSCGQIQFTELDRKRKIEEFCWREIDRQWLQPSPAPASASTSTLTTPRSKIERPEIAKKEHYDNHRGADEFKDELGPGQTNYEGMDSETDSTITAHVKYLEDERSITMPKQEWGLSNLQKRVVEAFSISNPPETLAFKVTDGTTENFDLDKYDPSTQSICVILGEASKRKKEKEKRKKIKLFINNKGKISSRLDLTDANISFAEFKENVKAKIKESADNFTIQISSGPNKNKLVASDADIGLLFCGESQLEIKIVYG